MFGIFNWIRRQAAQAVLDGVADAIDKLAEGDTLPDAGTLAVTLPDALAKRLTASVAVATETEGGGEAANGNGKGRRGK